jgi:hypothetical protein
MESKGIRVACEAGQSSILELVLYLGYVDAIYFLSPCLAMTAHASNDSTNLVERFPYIHRETGYVINVLQKKVSATPEWRCEVENI